jgi:hypothetical protein
LRRRGYLYDASTLPTFIGPVARAYYFLNARLSDEEKEQRSALFGSIRDGFRPLRCYRWKPDPDESHEGLIEIPVTTLPFLRIPFHFSYILFIAGLSVPMALAYFQAALALCVLTRVQPSLLLHPLDFLGCDDLGGLEFFPAMNLTGAAKIEVVSKALIILREGFRVSTVKEHARWHATSTDRGLVEPRFGASRAIGDHGNSGLR